MRIFYTLLTAQHEREQFRRSRVSEGGLLPQEQDSTLTLWVSLVIMTADNLQQKVKSSQSLFLGGNSSVEEKEAEVKQDEQAIEEQPFLSLPVKS